MAVCEIFDPDCYGCQLRAKAVSVSPSATPNRTSNRPQRRRPSNAKNSWERGIVTDQRPDGSAMPILDASNAPIHVKQYGEERRSIDERVGRLKSPTSSSEGSA